MTFALMALAFKVLGISGWVLLGVIVGKRLGGNQ